MKKGIVLACCVMLLAGQLQSAEALDWNRRIGVNRMIDRTIDNTINRAVNKVEKQEKTRRVIFQNLPQSAAGSGLYRGSIGSLRNQSGRGYCYAQQAAGTKTGT